MLVAVIRRVLFYTNLQLMGSFDAVTATLQYTNAYIMLV